MVKVLPIWQSKQLQDGKTLIISTVSKSSGWQKDLSPFLLGPCKLFGDYRSKTMENAWQYSKVYSEHLDNYGWPSKKWWKWAEEGWKNPKAIRYPMGKGRKPKYSYWEENYSGVCLRLTYVEARKIIYAPLYYRAVKKTEGWKKLKELYEKHGKIILLDFDAYDHRHLGMTLTDVLNCPTRKMGHAFVLAMMLQKDKALKQMEI